MVPKGKKTQYYKGVKRIGNIYTQIISIDNLNLADQRAKKGKSKQPGVINHNKQSDENILKLHEQLLDKTFKTSKYSTFIVHEPKERIVFRLPYYPDRIVHHAIMNYLKPLFNRLFTNDTYSCIEGKGVHKASDNLSEALKDVANTTYCLKLDVSKFYPSIDHEILKAQLRRKIKDNDLLWLLDEIIDSTDGLPIGNYTSQYFGNFYLTGFDHWLKEQKGVKYYFRYTDDMVILSHSKPFLHSLLIDIKQYLNDNLKLQVKDNYQVFPVSSRGVDFVGYVHFHTHKLLRKSIKKSFAKAVVKKKGKAVIASYWGWAKHANTHNLLTKLLPNEKF